MILKIDYSIVGLNFNLSVYKLKQFAFCQCEVFPLFTNFYIIKHFRGGNFEHYLNTNSLEQHEIFGEGVTSSNLLVITPLALTMKISFYKHTISYLITWFILYFNFFKVKINFKSYYIMVK